MNLIECIMKNSRCYKNTSTITPIGICWHSTGANNPTIKRYVQPDITDANYFTLLNTIGQNIYSNDWNHSQASETTHAVIGKLADETIASVQCLPWNYRSWSCGKGNKGSGNDFMIHFEIAEDSLADASYFNKVYREAVELTAYLCRLFSIDPKGKIKDNIPTITCHAELHEKGYASNHSDVLHWFKLYGKTMENVREDVEKILREGDIVTQDDFNKMMEVYLAEQAKKPTSSWATGTVAWAQGQGLLAGEPQGQKLITRQEALALLQRMWNKLK